MPCHHHNPTTVTFPGFWAFADWHPPVLLLLQIPLKEPDEANMVAYYVVRTLVASSSLALFSNHGRNRPTALRTKGNVCFFVGLLLQACSPVCVRRPLMCNTPAFASTALRTELSGPWTKCVLTGGKTRGIEGRGKVRFLSFSISSLQLAVSVRSFSFELITWHENELLTFQNSARS